MKIKTGKGDVFEIYLNGGPCSEKHTMSIIAALALGTGEYPYVCSLSDKETGSVVAFCFSSDPILKGLMEEAMQTVSEELSHLELDDYGVTDDLED